MSNLEIFGQPDHMILALRGEMGIQQAGEVREALLQALELAQWLELDLSAAREVRLPCLQLLCAAHQSARRLNKRLSLAPGCSPDFRDTVLRSGYPRQMGCSGPGSECLWNFGGER